MPHCPKCGSFKLTSSGVRNNKRRYRCRCGAAPSFPIETSPGKEEHNEEKAERLSINGSEYTSDKIIEIVYSEMKNERSLLKAHGFDPEEWTLVHATNNLWHSQRPNDLGQLVMCQSKITCRPRDKTKEISEENIIKLISSLKPIKPNGNLKPIKTSPNKWLEITVTDLHLGDEGTEETVEKFLIHMREIAAKIKGQGYKVCFAQMGDLMAYDTFARTTTKGTQQHTSMSYDEVWKLSADTMIEAISVLADVAEVDVVSVCGNHDRVSVFTIFQALSFYFKYHPRVKVDAVMSNRKYRVFGPTLVYFVHGDVPQKNIDSLCEREAREEFGKSVHAEIHLGHLHHEYAKEADGVTLRWLKSLAKTNEWHYYNGYTGTSPALMSFVWDDKGLREMWWSR